MNEETKYCARLPVVAIGSVMFVDRHDFDGADAIETFRSLTLLDEGETELCRLTDAQDLIAEKDARIAELESHIRTDNTETLANAVSATRTQLDMAETLNTKVRTQLARLQAAPAERGVVLPERKLQPDGYVCQPLVNDGWNACLDEFARLNPSEPKAQNLGQCADFPNCPNLYCPPSRCTRDPAPAPAPATADSDVREVSE